MKVTTDACLFGSLVAASHAEKKVEKILDIGTGTGLLSLMYSQKNADAEIDAIEIDKETADQARENVKASPWKEKIKVICGDIKEFDPGKKYDLVISNPPFYEKELRSPGKQKNIAHHQEGLLLNELAVIIKNQLKPDGNFCLLLPYKRYGEIKKLFTENKFEILKMIFVKQSVSHDYFRIILTGALQKSEPVPTELIEIAICNENQEYTPAFVNLLKDYYLRL